MKRDFVHTVIIDPAMGHVLLDGKVVPYWIVEQPEISRPDDGVPISLVTMTFLVDGLVVVKHSGDEDGRIIDPVLGDVGEWANAYVRSALEDRLPWLQEEPTP